MAKIVLGKLEQLDFRTTLEKVHVIESVGGLTVTKGESYVLEHTDHHAEAVRNAEHSVYLPVSALTTGDKNQDVKVYFDLENYPFYQKAQEMIRQEAKPKGVFRFRRTLKQAVNESIIAEDLYVLSSLLGEPEDVQVSQSNQSVLPIHIILMINFGGGTMAHMEYTFTQTDQERIEFEWSGVKNIIEFDSEALKPIQPDHHRNLALIYPVDSILNTAHQVDQELIDRLDHFKKLINGGAK